MRFRGVITPLLTPFNDDGSINYEHLERNLKAWNEWNIDGVVVNGSGGEFPHTSQEEQMDLVKFVKARTSKFVIACVPEQGTKLAADGCRKAAEAGADAALVFVPYYWRDALSDDVIFDHFTAVADSSPIPVLLYANPPSTLFEISVNVAVKLADHPNIVGMKDSTADRLLAKDLSQRVSVLFRYRSVSPVFDDLSLQVSKLGLIAQATKGKHFDVLVGRDTLLVPGWLLGCSGGIVGMSSSLGKLHGEMQALVKDHRFEEAAEIHHKITSVAAAVTSMSVIPALKALMDIVGLYGGPPRAPLKSIPEAGTAKLRDAVEKIGFKL
ncbi:unnamed protein product [Notodromas monacha]|uniref:4-hydroxy-2-oxoglutarate aldolase, mitochondrial n=1 Tax=Notodromas monacha TaxID=399045 RepID=A0A7R9GCP5_9CRUS|nr:unnamed protein product [Notodromas monacha]CAG0916320.1 unnamed protein product [Notodromas monacha]